MSIQKVKDWVAQTSVYPPAHIYQGMVQGKQEKLAIKLCEELYRFNHGNQPNVLGELRASWRELEVTMKMAESDSENIFVLDSYWAKVIGEFLYWAKEAVHKMDEVYKGHQAVNAYYNEWKLKAKEINSAMYDTVTPQLWIKCIEVYDEMVKTHDK